jgi:hypothetical protein
MGKAIIRNIDNSGSGGTPVPSPTGGATGGDVMTGTLQDSQTNQEFRFEQPLGSEEGLAVGSNVDYYTVSVNGLVVSNCVRPQKGVLDLVGDILPVGIIQTVNSTDDGGTLLNQIIGGVIPFKQNYCAASGLVEGALVNFLTVNDPAGGPTGIALLIVLK